MDQKTASQTGGVANGQWNPLDHQTGVGGLVPNTTFPATLPVPQPCPTCGSCPTCGRYRPNTFTVPYGYPTVPSAF